MSGKDEIPDLIEDLPETPSYDDAFQPIHPVYNREGAPSSLSKATHPAHWAAGGRDTTGSAEAEEQRTELASNTELLCLRERIPTDSSTAETVDDEASNLALP